MHRSTNSIQHTHTTPATLPSDIEGQVTVNAVPKKLSHVSDSEGDLPMGPSISSKELLSDTTNIEVAMQQLIQTMSLRNRNTLSQSWKKDMQRGL